MVILWFPIPFISVYYYQGVVLCVFGSPVLHMIWFGGNWFGFDSDFGFLLGHRAFAVASYLHN